MPTFTSADEALAFMGKVWDEAFAHPVLGDELAASGVVLKLHYTEPQAVITVDMPNKKVIYGPDGPTPLVELFMTADVAHRFWLGKVNVSMALAKGQMRAKGPIPVVLKLVPAAKALFPLYRELLEQAGRQDLINA